MKLSDRLEKILENIGHGKVLADIGTDHGFIPIEAVARGLYKTAIACDINPGPLKKADEHIKAARLTNQIETRLADGLSGLKPGECGTIVIAGMGGMLMRDILLSGEQVWKSADLMVLSPQSDLTLLREYLLSEGCGIISESCVFDDGKYYFIINAAPQDNAAKDYTGAELEYGREALFDEASQAVRSEYIKKELKTYRKVISKLSKIDTPAASERKKELERLICDMTGGIN